MPTRTPIVFRPTQQGKVWGLNDASEHSKMMAERVEIRPGEFVDARAVEAPAAPLSKAEANAEFVAWLQEAYPEIVAAMVEALESDDVIRAGDGGLGAAEGDGFMSRLVEMTETVLPAYLQYQQQSDILDVQLDRARQGLPPLRVDAYAPSMQIALDRQTVTRFADEASLRAREFARSPLPWILGAGVLATLFFMSRRKRR